MGIGAPFMTSVTAAAVCRSTRPAWRALRLLSSSARSNPILSLSKSRFKEKRGLQHGSSFLQTKGRLSATRLIPDNIARPPYALGLPIPPYPEPQIHDEKSISNMRRANEIAARVLAYAGEVAIQVGATTDEIDAIVHDQTIRLGAYPSPLGYAGFPKSVCTSINEVVCHGIPDLDAKLRKGDIVKLDVSCYVGGVHGDTCRTFIAGGTDALDASGKHLVQSTKHMLDSAIKICGPGVPIKAIGAHIGSLCDELRLENVDLFSGHGIGETFHTEPIVHHKRNESRYIMKPGMTFTIEPMITEGSGDVELWPDGWTVVTRDRGRSAQYEHTILITQHGAEVLTKYE